MYNQYLCSNVLWLVGGIEQNKMYWNSTSLSSSQMHNCYPCLCEFIQKQNRTEQHEKYKAYSDDKLQAVQKTQQKFCRNRYSFNVLTGPGAWSATRKQLASPCHPQILRPVSKECIAYIFRFFWNESGTENGGGTSPRNKNSLPKIWSSFNL